VFIKRFNHYSAKINTRNIHFQISLSRPRYLAVSVGNAVSQVQGQAVCAEVGEGLATVLTDADYVALNATVHQSGAPYGHCNANRVLMGAESSGSYNWKWRTGDALSISWANWKSGQPNDGGATCMRAAIAVGAPVIFADNTCGTDKGYNCILCDA